MLRQKSLQQQQRHQPQRFAVTQKGDPCKLCIRKGAFCHLHQSQRIPVGKTDHHLTEANEEHSLSPSSNFGFTRKGDSCKLCIRKGAFCHLHEGQRDGIDTGYLTATRGNEGSSQQSRNLGISREGVPCKLCIRKGAFCHFHDQSQRSPGKTDHLTGVNEELSQPSPIFGITRTGDPCKLCIRKGTFCHLHHLQSRSEETEDFVAAKVNTKQSQPSRSFGFTRKGEPCKTCIRQGQFCHQHERQIDRDFILPKEDTRGVGFDKEPLQPSNVFITTQKEQPPKIFTGKDVFCLPVGTQEGRNVPFRKEDARAPEQYSQPPMVFGTTQAGEPCKICIKKGDFCHHHEKQREFGITQKGEPCKLCIRKGDFCHHHEKQKVFGITQKGEPCKLCFRKGDYCHHHEKQRVFGLTRKGEPCKICIRKGDFCGYHKLQKPIAREESMAQEQQSEPSGVFGISQNGEPCRICIRKGDFCHYHEIQRGCNELKDGTICPEDLGGNKVQDGPLYGRAIRRSCSLIALAVLLQCLFFNALNGWVGEATLWDLSSCNQTITNNNTLGVDGNENAPNCHQLPLSFPFSSTMLHAFGRETPPTFTRINGFDSGKPLRNQEACGNLQCLYSQWAEWASF